MSEAALVNRLLSGAVFNKLSHKWIQENIGAGKVFLMDDGRFLIDENGEYRKHLQSSTPKAINDEREHNN